MISALRGFVKILPTLLTAFVLALAVWISSVTANDPTREEDFAQPVPIEVIGQDPGMVITSNLPNSVSLRLRAPQSVWNNLNRDQAPVRAIADLSGLEAGTYNVPIQVQVGIRPVEIVSYTPRSISVTLERLVSRTMKIDLIVRGEPAVGFQADQPVLGQEEVTISGPESLVSQVERVRAILDIASSSDTIERTLTLQAVDSSDMVVNGVAMSPDRVSVKEAISQRYGYRNVVVKVQVTGEIANGYRLTNISVFPPAVTVYSPDPQTISNLPGYVTTVPVDLTNVRDDLDISVALDLPNGVSVVGDNNEVLVRVSVAAIESSLTLENMPVQITGLPGNLSAQVSPETVTVILNGPLAFLDQINRENTRVFIDLTGAEVGTYQVSPQVDVIIKDVTVESILPATVEVAVKPAPTPTPTR